MLRDRTYCNINFRATVHANRARNFSYGKIIDGKPEKPVRGRLLNFTWLEINRRLPSSILFSVDTTFRGKMYKEGKDLVKLLP